MTGLADKPSINVEDLLTHMFFSTCKRYYISCICKVLHGDDVDGGRLYIQRVLQGSFH